MRASLHVASVSPKLSSFTLRWLFSRVPQPYVPLARSTLKAATKRLSDDLLRGERWGPSLRGKMLVFGWGHLQRGSQIVIKLRSRDDALSKNVRIRERAKVQRWTSGTGQTWGQYIRGCREEAAIYRRPRDVQYHGMVDIFGGICSAHNDTLDCSLLSFLPPHHHSGVLWQPWLYMTPYPELHMLHWVWALDPVAANQNPSP